MSLLLLLAMTVSCMEGAGEVPLSLCSSVPFTCCGGLGAVLLARPGLCGGDLEGEWLLLYWLEDGAGKTGDKGFGESRIKSRCMGELGRIGLGSTKPAGVVIMGCPPS